MACYKEGDQVASHLAMRSSFVMIVLMLTIHAHLKTQIIHYIAQKSTKKQ